MEYIISVPQITPLSKGGAIISSKTDLHSGNNKKKRRYGKVRNKKAMSIILPFIRIIYLKQQSNILRCFCSLKFEKKLSSNKFFNFIFHTKMIALTSEKD